LLPRFIIIIETIDVFFLKVTSSIVGAAVPQNGPSKLCSELTILQKYLMRHHSIEAIV